VTWEAIQEKLLVHIPNLVESRAPAELIDEGFISYHAVPMIAKGKVKGVLEVFHRKGFIADREWLDFLETLAGQAAIAIDSVGMFQDIQRSNLELKSAYDATIEGLSNALDLRDKETENHSKWVTDITVALAIQFNYSVEDLKYIRWGALLHDIGKLGVPDRILFKSGCLSEEEWLIMRQHPSFAYNLLSGIEYLRPALEIPYSHHEMWDGSGYPLGLIKDQIPLAARIFTVVDVFDALISERPYRETWSEKKALDHIQEQSGKKFDPMVVNAFIRLMKEDSIKNLPLLDERMI